MAVHPREGSFRDALGDGREPPADLARSRGEFVVVDTERISSVWTAGICVTGLLIDDHVAREEHTSSGSAFERAAPPDWRAAFSSSFRSCDA